MKNRKSQDPTEAALSAIEDALNIGKEAPEVAPPQPERRIEAPRPPREREPAEEVFAQRSRGTRERLPRQPAANDDRPSVGQILSALHRRPSAAPILLALLGSMVWIIGGALLAAAQFRDENGAVMRLSEIAAQPTFIAALAAIFLPPLLFFMTALLVRRSQEMRHISRAMTEVTLRLAEPEGVSTDAIVSVGQAIRREVAALGDGIERAIARASELEAMVRNEVATLERAYDENENRVRALVEELHLERDSIVQHATRLRESIAGAHEAFSFDVQGIADRVAGALDNATGRITDNISLRAEDARNHLTAAGDQIVNNLTTAGETVVANLSDRSAEATQRLTEVGVQIAKAIADRNEKVSEALQQSTTDMHARLTERAAGISQMIADASQTFENTVGAQLQALADTVLTRGNEVAGRVAADAGALGARITEGLQTFDSTVKVFGNNLIAEMKGTIGAVGEAARDSLSSFDERISGKMSEVSDQIDARISRIEQTLDTRTTTLNEALANRTLEFARTLNEGAKSATETVDKSVAGIGEYFSAKGQELANVISERAEKIDETLGNRAMQLAETLDSRVTKFEETVVGRMENISASVEQKGVAVADLLVERVESVNELLRSNAAQVETHLTQLADGITKNFIERVNNITGAHETLRSEVRDIIQELGQTHSLLQASIDTASSTLGPIESKVAEKVAAFHHTLENAISSTRTTAERMDVQIRELNDASNGVLRDVSNLTLRFEEQVRLVASTTESLSETHRRIDQGLADRRNAIETITALLTERSNEFEQRLSRFNSMLQETFAEAQNKATDVARTVAESTAGATQSIARQYELIRNSSSEERDRTNAALKDTYNEAMESVNAMFSEANARFLDAARDLREISDDIQRTMETTREEIRRTVFELPAETKESANAMRRVVADQIKALSELNDIVARHGRGGIEQNAYGYREEEMLAVGGRGSPRNALPRPQDDYEDDLATRPARTRIEPQEPRRPERAPADRGARLNEALAKAPVREREAEADDMAGGIESIDSLSSEIARMVDHDAAAEAWDRYKGGDRSAFTRRLYTNAGQKTFEEMRRKYRRSPEFRETVDRYIDEFERLLEQVSRDKRGEALTKTYLTSETGKVYTLLAHAAGRLN